MKREKGKEAHDNDVELVEHFQQRPVEAAESPICVGGPDQGPEHQRDHDTLAKQGDRQAVVFVEPRVFRLDIEIRKRRFD